MSQDGFVLILGCEAGVCKVAIYVTPFTKATIIEKFEVVCDDKGNDVISQAFLEHDEAIHSPIAILEGMYLLETDMEVEDVFE